MAHLDVQVPQLVVASGDFGDQAALMRSTIATAEAHAQAAQGFNMGDFSLAFQGAHMRFVDAGTKINTLIDIACANQGEAAATYTTVDGASASNIASSIGSIGT